MIYVICWLMSGLIGTLVGIWTRKPIAGAVWGLAVGPAGWLLVGFTADRRPKCAECLATVNLHARKCKHCGSPIELAPVPEESRLIHFVRNRTWCDLVAILILGGLLAYAGNSHWRSSWKDEGSNGRGISLTDESNVSTRDAFRRVAAKLMPRQPDSQIGLYQYNQLELGVDYADVCDILNSSGQETTSRQITDPEPVEFSSYRWSNKDGSYISCNFRNWRLIEKSQYGLQ